MKLGTIIELLSGEALTPVNTDLEIAGACAASLMSDVLAGVRSGALLLTGLCSLQVIRTAQVTDIAAIVFVNGKRPPEDVIAVAREEGLPLLCTPLPTFEACGSLYQAGLTASFCTLRT